MGSIGNWWVKGIPARPDEQTRAGFYANRLRESGRPIGGKLYVTNERLLFSPHLLDSLLGGEPHEVELADITQIERAVERDEGGSNGLRITLTNDTVVQYIVNEREDALAAIADERSD